LTGFRILIVDDKKRDMKPFRCERCVVLLSADDDPEVAATRTVEMTYEAARHDRDLRSSPGYRNPSEYAEEPAWEAALESQLLSRELRDQLDALDTFMSDPVVLEAQRIYENAQRVIANYGRQRARVVRDLRDSPRRLFDLIAGINAVLDVA